MTAFSYRLVRSRRRTLALMITRLGELEVRAPLGLPQADIDRFVEQKQDWITSRLRERERASLPAFRWGDTVPFLGREAPVWSGEASAFDGGGFSCRRGYWRRIGRGCGKLWSLYTGGRRRRFSHG